MEIKDSFGVEVAVGDYLVFAIKTRYLGSLGLGRVIKISPKGSITMITVHTYGKTIQELAEETRNLQERMRVYYEDRVAKGLMDKVPDWVYKDPPEITARTTLATASTCYKIPAHAVPIDIAQHLVSGEE